MLDYSTGTRRHGILIARKAVNGISGMVPQTAVQLQSQSADFHYKNVTLPCLQSFHLHIENKTVDFHKQLIFVYNSAAPILFNILSATMSKQCVKQASNMVRQTVRPLIWVLVLVYVHVPIRN